MTRELVAYTLIGATAVFLAITFFVALSRRRRTMLRRRGIKRYGH